MIASIHSYFYPPPPPLCAICLDPDDKSEQVPAHDADGLKHPFHKTCLDSFIKYQSEQGRAFHCPACNRSQLHRSQTNDKDDPRFFLIGAAAVLLIATSSVIGVAGYSAAIGFVAASQEFSTSPLENTDVRQFSRFTAAITALATMYPIILTATDLFRVVQDALSAIRNRMPPLWVPNSILLSIPELILAMAPNITVGSLFIWRTLVVIPLTAERVGSVIGFSAQQGYEIYGNIGAVATTAAVATPLIAMSYYFAKMRESYSLASLLQSHTWAHAY